MADLWKYNVRHTDLEIIEKIAAGGFGAVFKGKLNGKPVAVKQLIEGAHNDQPVSICLCPVCFVLVCLAVLFLIVINIHTGSISRVLARSVYE